MVADPEPLEARYANYFRVGHNSHEVLFDFGQFQFDSAQMDHEPARLPIIRIIMGPSFAKAFLIMVREAIEQYEAIHGSLDLSSDPADTSRPRP